MMDERFWSIACVVMTVLVIGEIGLIIYFFSL